MLSFRIEERVTDKNCSVTGLKRGVDIYLDITRNIPKMDMAV